MTILTNDIVAWWSLTKKKGFRIAPEALSAQILIKNQAIITRCRQRWRRWRVTAPFLSVLTPEYTQSV